MINIGLILLIGLIILDCSHSCTFLFWSQLFTTLNSTRPTTCAPPGSAQVLPASSLCLCCVADAAQVLIFSLIFSVLLGVQEQALAERSFKARLERRLALLLEEGLQASSRRRWRRATAVGNNSLQVKWQKRVKNILVKGKRRESQIGDSVA